MKLSIFALTIGAFGIGMTEFVMMGILPDLSEYFHISIPVAGYLISSYAIGVVFGAPMLIGLAGGLPPKRLLVGLMWLFTVSNGLSALAPNFELMLFTRLLSGVPHGAFFGVGAVVAVRLSAQGKEAQAMSLMFLGLTIANIIGVPLGTFIGHNLGWRFTFVSISMVGIMTVFALKRWMPELPAPAKSSLAKDLKVFGRIEPWIVLIIIMIGTGGFFAWFSYIAPLMTSVVGFNDNEITYILIIAGIGMAIGNLVGGKLADHSPVKSAHGSLLAMTLVLIMMVYASQFKMTALVMTFIIGGIAFAVGSPLQMLLIRSSKGSEMLASSFGQGAFNVGNALGAFLGGLPIAAGLGYTSPEWVGACMAFIGFLIAVIATKKLTSISKQV
jgi:DHA1 family arabinose polymer transporter-like MFS transporter